MPQTQTTHTTLPADTNQALGLARFALDFMWNTPAEGGADPDPSVLERTEMFHTDASLCGISALALGTNAPTLLRAEALGYTVAQGGTGSLAPLGAAVRHGATVFGSNVPVQPEKAVVANSAAVREWDSNGTNFGYNPELGHTAGEFGHNDFYPVPIAAAQMMNMDGRFALRGMVLLDEIRGRLAEVFSLKSYKIDHVVHGAIASAATFGAMLKAAPEQIESAIGMVLAHYIPFRAIRAGKQLSDSKGASAAISSEAAVLSVKRSMRGFLGPRDIFRNPEAIFRLFEGPGQMLQKVGATDANLEKKNASPFDLVLARAGSDFAVMGMHFKLGLYEHQSAGALQGLIDLLNKNPALLDDPSGGRIRSIEVTAYEPAFGIIGDPAKRDPKTRQSADHSMLYLVCTKLRKALDLRQNRNGRGVGALGFKELMLLPDDFSNEAIQHRTTRSLMDKMTFVHGGPEYDRRYPDGIPTSIAITDAEGFRHDSGMVMYPAGHARNTTADLKGILGHKWTRLAELAVAGADTSAAKALTKRYSGIAARSARDIAALNDFTLHIRGRFE